MTIKVNGKTKEFNKAGIKLTELLMDSGIAKPELVSVQLNGNFVKREEYAETGISEGDEIDYLFFMGGGAGVSFQEVNLFHSS